MAPSRSDGAIALTKVPASAGGDEAAIGGDFVKSLPTVAIDGPGAVAEAGTVDEKMTGVDEDDFPFKEGGLRGWLNVFGAFLVLFSTFGYANAFGVYQSYYSTHQFANMEPSAIAWLGSVGVWLEFSSALFTGPLFDRGYIRSSLAAGSSLFVLVLFMMSLATKFWQAFLAQGIGMGIAMGLTYVPAISVLSHYFQKRRSFVMGIAMTGSSMGGICFPILLNSTFAKIGFAKGVQASGYLVLGCLLIANVLLKPKPPKISAVRAAKKRASVRDILSELRYSVAVAACFFATLSNFFPVYYIQTFFEVSGLPPNLTFYSLAFLNAGSCFGRIIATYIADRVGTLNVMAASCVGAAIMTFSMFGATNPAGAIIFAVLYGAFSGAIFALISPVFVALSTDITEIGLRQGVALFVSGLAALIGPPISGALLSADGGDFRYAIIFSGGSMAIGAALFSWSRMLMTGVKGTWAV